MEQNFDNYMKNYKTLPLKEKQSIIFEQLKIITSLTKKMCEEIGVENKLILSDELTDLSKDDYTEDDFAEAIVTLINSVQNSLCDFNLKLSEINDYLKQ